MENVTLEKSTWVFKSVLDYVEEWPLMKSPGPLFVILASYLLLVLKTGPEYMKNRPAYKLNTILTLYNLFQVAFSIYLVHTGLELLRPVGYIGVKCDLDNDLMKQISNSIYLYFTAKVTELLDTIFFVLRKKQNQVTFLHVYHHSMMVITTWMTLKLEPSYTTIFLFTLNSFVHVVMYSYYGLSAFPSLTKFLWWKRYITTLQLSQFVMVFVHAIGNYFCSQCPPSPILLTVIMFNSLFFIYLFGKFYIKSYVKNKTIAGKVSTEKCSGRADANWENKNGAAVKVTAKCE